MSKLSPVTVPDRPGRRFLRCEGQVRRRRLSHRQLARAFPPYLRDGQRRSISMEMLLAVLLVLMIPGLLTYLVPERRTETARD